MKNVQIIDGAANCTYSVYAFTDDEFNKIFPDEGQDIEFIEDFVGRVGAEEAGQILQPVWERTLEKTQINGIHGTLFYELDHKKKYYPNKRDKDMVTSFGVRYWRES